MIKIDTCPDLGIKDLMNKVFAVKGQVDSLADENDMSYIICESDLNCICVCIETLKEVLAKVNKPRVSVESRIHRVRK